MLRRIAAACSALRLEHNGHLDFATRQLVPLRGVVDDLIHGDRNEVDIHKLHNRSHAHQRATDSASGNGRFGDGGIFDLLRAELLKQPRRRSVQTAPAPNVFAH